MLQFLIELESEIRERYGDATLGYIDLSLEPALKGHIENAQATLGVARPEAFAAPRAKGTPAYRPRL